MVCECIDISDSNALPRHVLVVNYQCSVFCTYNVCSPSKGQAKLHQTSQGDVASAIDVDRMVQLALMGYNTTCMVYG